MRRALLAVIVASISGCALLGSLDDDYHLATGSEVGGAAAGGGATSAGGTSGAGGAGGGAESPWWLVIGPVAGNANSKLSVKAIDSTGDGGVVVAGMFDGSVDFAGTSVMAAGTSDMFVARVGPGGTPLWLVPLVGDGYDEPFGVAYDPDANQIAVAGRCSGVYTPNGQLGTATDPQGCVLFLSGSDGGIVSAMDFGAPGELEVASDVVYADGAAYVVGSWFSEVGMTVSPCTNAVPPAQGNREIILLRLHADGPSCDWAAFHGSPGPDDAAAIQVNGDRIHVVGHVGGDIPSLMIDTDESDAADAFITELDLGGNPQWGAIVDGVGNDYAYAVAMRGDEPVMAGLATTGARIYDGPLEAQQTGFLVAYAGGAQSFGEEVGASTSVLAAVGGERLVLGGIVTGFKQTILGLTLTPTAYAVMDGWLAVERASDWHVVHFHTDDSDRYAVVLGLARHGTQVFSGGHFNGRLVEPADLQCLSLQCAFIGSHGGLLE